MTKRRSDYYDDWWYERSEPIAVEDGIKARSQRGKFTSTWWADRWIAALKELMDSGRLQRGRSYARRGQVLNIDVAPGQVTARVQGTRPSPYKVSIRLAPLDRKQWDRVLDALAEQALFAAQLLNGEMPPDVEDVFHAVQVPLFPGSRADLRTQCSCPDAANPCKHIAAVYYLLGEQFDTNPFLLFELRGRSQQQIAAALRERRAASGAPGPEPAGAPDEEEAAPAALEAPPDRYWALGEGAADLALDIGRPEVEGALLKRLGAASLPGWRPGSLEAHVERIYRAVTDRALQVAFAEAEDEPGEPA